MSFDTVISRICLVSGSFFVLCCGLAFLSSSVYVYVVLRRIFELVFRTTAVLVIAVSGVLTGCFLTAAAFLACFPTFWPLMFFGMLEVVGSGGAAVFYYYLGDLHAVVHSWNQTQFMTQLNRYNGENETDLTEAIDAMQHYIKCCGAESPNDWSQVPGLAVRNNASVPDTCCRSKERGCGINALNGTKTAIFTDGCLTLVQLYVNEIDYWKTVGIITVAGFLVSALLTSYCYIHTVGQQGTLVVPRMSSERSQYTVPSPSRPPSRLSQSGNSNNSK